MITKSIVYESKKNPHGRAQELKVAFPRGKIVDVSYAAAMVAVRTGMALAEVNIIKIADVDE